MPVALAAYPLWIDIFCWSLIKVQSTGQRIQARHRGRGTPVELLKQYVVTTGRKPRYLRVDNAKEFTLQEMVDYCKDNDIILQPVVATTQCKHAWSLLLAAQTNTAAVSL